MTLIRLRYVHRFRDRHGKQRYYFRRDGRRVPLPGLPGSEAFMRAYEAALADNSFLEIGAGGTAPGSISALIVTWYRSADFSGLAESTKTTYRGIIERFRANHGDKPVRQLEARHVRKIIAAKADTPAAANNLLRCLRVLMRFAVENGWRADDPTQGVRGIRHRSEGFHTWSDAEIAQFEATHPIGTRARLALGLFLYTGCRRSDVVKLGWQHIDGGVLRYRQQKTAVLVEVPIHSELMRILAAEPKDRLTFLITAQGRPFSPTGLYNWFSSCCAKAGLPGGCSPHGLRKAIARRLAEAGCSPHQIQAVTGHRTLKEVSKYTEAANRGAMAADAIAKLGTKGEH